MSRYTIKEVGPAYGSVREDIDRMHKECFPENDRLPTLTGYWWIVYHEGEPVGFAAMQPSSNWEKTGYLYRSGVLPDHRGKGLQKRLIKTREKKARELGWHTMVSDTTGTVYSANNLIKAGYLLFDPPHPWGFKNTNYWYKRL